MDYLLARIDTRKKANIRLILSDKTTYHDVDVSKSKVFDNDYKLQDGEWFVVNEFNKASFFKDWIKSPFNAGDYSQIQVSEYSGIRFLVAYQGNDMLLFQRLFSGIVYENKTFLTLSVHDQPDLRNDHHLIVINKEPDAIYVLSKNQLFFKSIPTVKPLFPGIESLYKEATNEEVQSFLEAGLIKIEGDFGVDKVTTLNRRYISEAKEIFDNYKDEDKRKLGEYVQKYRPNLNFNLESFSCEVSNDNQLKELVYCILQRYYTTEIGEQKRIAYSVEKI